MGVRSRLAVTSLSTAIERPHRTARYLQVKLQESELCMSLLRINCLEDPSSTMSLCIMTCHSKRADELPTKTRLAVCFEGRLAGPGFAVQLEDAAFPHRNTITPLCRRSADTSKQIAKTYYILSHSSLALWRWRYKSNGMTFASQESHTDLTHCSSWKRCLSSCVVSLRRLSSSCLFLRCGQRTHSLQPSSGFPALTTPT